MISCYPGQHYRPTPGVADLAHALSQTAVVVGMVGITYASVPLYRMFCQVRQPGALYCNGRHRCCAASEVVAPTAPSPVPALRAQATGFGGTVQRVKSVEEKIRDSEDSEQAQCAPFRPKPPWGCFGWLIVLFFGISRKLEMLKECNVAYKAPAPPKSRTDIGTGR